MMATVLAGIAEFERELTAERIRSGIAAAKARGKKLGRQSGQRPKSDWLAPRVLALVAQGRSYRLIGREVGLSKKHGGGDRPTGSNTFRQPMTQDSLTFCSA
jgi:putative DNA-invertase from lambdoid prophage Rac